MSRSRGHGVVTVWSRCGHGVVTVWSRCGHGVVTDLEAGALGVAVEVDEHVRLLVIDQFRQPEL